MNAKDEDVIPEEDEFHDNGDDDETMAGNPPMQCLMSSSH